METGYLNKYFSGVIVKKLSEVEANIESSISMSLMEIKLCDRYWERTFKEESLTRYFYIWKMNLQ